MPRTRPFVTTPEAYDRRVRKPDVKYVVFDLTGDDTPTPVPLVRSPARPLLSLLNEEEVDPQELGDGWRTLMASYAWLHEQRELERTMGPAARTPTQARKYRREQAARQRMIDTAKSGGKWWLVKGVTVDNPQ